MIIAMSETIPTKEVILLECSRGILSGSEVDSLETRKKR
jgi:hypothetical protein